ncbi:TRAUB-domain-containing protein [Panus rudis PR-1116 ss-1]|nr:TRAUB-domain-containing protein [Panus rudis PR-1116 ss-1]
MSASIDGDEQNDERRMGDFDPSEELPVALDTGVTEHYIDVGPSKMRHDALADPKYGGARVSRAQLSDEEDEGSESDGDRVSERYVNGEHVPSSEEEDSDSSEAESEVQTPSQSPTVPQKSTAGQTEGNENQTESSSVRVLANDDRRKGKAVVHQLAMWDALLDARIRLQKALTFTNTLPPSSHYPDLSTDETVQRSLDSMLDEATALSQELATLQESIARLDNTFPPVEIQNDVDIADLDVASQVTALSRNASAIEASHHPNLVTTLTKWSTKIQAAQPSFLLPSNRGSFKSAWNKQDQRPPGVVQVIQDDLNSGEKLLERTRTLRSGKGKLGDQQWEEEADKTDIFDDTDFYQQLLRDVIDNRGREVEEEGWVARQQARKAKKRANVDTKASKGRKLRYEVHEKIQHFMVPIPVVQGGWHEDQIDDLFLSLAKYEGDP